VKKYLSIGAICILVAIMGAQLYLHTTPLGRLSGRVTALETENEQSKCTHPTTSYFRVDSLGVLCDPVMYRVDDPPYIEPAFCEVCDSCGKIIRNLTIAEYEKIYRVLARDTVVVRADYIGDNKDGSVFNRVRVYCDMAIEVIIEIDTVEVEIDMGEVGGTVAIDSGVVQGVGNDLARRMLFHRILYTIYLNKGAHGTYVKFNNINYYNPNYKGKD